MERNDPGKHKRLVNHQASTNANTPGKAIIMIDMLTVLPCEGATLKKSCLKTRRDLADLGKLYDSF